MDEFHHPRLRPFDPDGKINPAALEGFQPVGRISGGDDEFFVKRIAEGHAAILNNMAEAAGKLFDPMHRLVDSLVDVNDTINKILDPDNHDPSERIHGFAIGDRVQTRSNDRDVSVFGHVVHVRRGCDPNRCRLLCKLVWVKEFDTDNVWKFAPTELEHID